MLICTCLMYICENHIHGTCWWAYETTTSAGFVFVFVWTTAVRKRYESVSFNKISAWDIISFFFIYILVKLIRSINFAFIIYIHFFVTQMFLLALTNLYLHTILTFFYLVRWSRIFFSVINSCMHFAGDSHSLCYKLQYTYICRGDTANRRDLLFYSTFLRCNIASIKTIRIRVEISYIFAF